MMASFLTPYRKKTFKRPNWEADISSIFVFVIFILQVVTAILSVQTMTSQWTELVVTWPYEITFCWCEFIVVILVKMCQLYVAKISSRTRKERYSWLILLLALPCLLLLFCSLVACRLVKVRTYNKLVWNLSQQESSESTLVHNARNATVPYIDIYQVISMIHYDSKTYVKMAWDTVQQKYQCCGSNAPQDWSMVRIQPPQSCCIDPDLPCSMQLAFRIGCSPKVTEVLFEQLRYLEVTIFILMIFEFLMMVLVFVSSVGARFLRITNKNKRTIRILASNPTTATKGEYFVPISTISAPMIDTPGIYLADHVW